jgi:hypothetical protein
MPDEVLNHSINEHPVGKRDLFEQRKLIEKPVGERPIDVPVGRSAE